MFHGFVCCDVIVCLHALGDELEILLQKRREFQNAGVLIADVERFPGEQVHADPLSIVIVARLRLPIRWEGARQLALSLSACPPCMKQRQQKQHVYNAR